MKTPQLSVKLSLIFTIGAAASLGGRPASSISIGTAESTTAGRRLLPPYHQAAAQAVQLMENAKAQQLVGALMPAGNIQATAYEPLAYHLAKFYPNLGETELTGTMLTKALHAAEEDFLHWKLGVADFFYQIQRSIRTSPKDAASIKSIFKQTLQITDEIETQMARYPDYQPHYSFLDGLDMRQSATIGEKNIFEAITTHFALDAATLKQLRLEAWHDHLNPAEDTTQGPAVAAGGLSEAPDPERIPTGGRLRRRAATTHPTSSDRAMAVFDSGFGYYHNNPAIIAERHGIKETLLAIARAAYEETPSAKDGDAPSKASTAIDFSQFLIYSKDGRLLGLVVDEVEDKKLGIDISNISTPHYLLDTRRFRERHQSKDAFLGILRAADRILGGKGQINIMAHGEYRTPPLVARSYYHSSKEYSSSLRESIKFEFVLMVALVLGACFTLTFWIFHRPQDFALMALPLILLLSARAVDKNFNQYLLRVRTTLGQAQKFASDRLGSDYPEAEILSFIRGTMAPDVRKAFVQEITENHPLRLAVIRERSRMAPEESAITSLASRHALKEALQLAERFARLDPSRLEPHRGMEYLFRDERNLYPRARKRLEHLRDTDDLGMEDIVLENLYRLDANLKALRSQPRHTPLDILLGKNPPLYVMPPVNASGKE